MYAGLYVDCVWICRAKCCWCCCWHETPPISLTLASAWGYLLTYLHTSHGVVSVCNNFFSLSFAIKICVSFLFSCNSIINSPKIPEHSRSCCCSSQHDDDDGGGGDCCWWLVLLLLMLRWWWWKWIVGDFFFWILVRCFTPFFTSPPDEIKSRQRLFVSFFSPFTMGVHNLWWIWKHTQKHTHTHTQNNNQEKR